MRSSSLALITILAIAFASAALAQLTQTGAGKKAHGGAAPSCSGAIDLSSGCPQPMLGVL